jgi:hypothetical protein
MAELRWSSPKFTMTACRRRRVKGEGKKVVAADSRVSSELHDHGASARPYRQRRGGGRWWRRERRRRIWSE